MLELKCQKLVHSTSKQNILQQRQKVNEKMLMNDHHSEVSLSAATSCIVNSALLKMWCNAPFLRCVFTPGNRTTHPFHLPPGGPLYWGLFLGTEDSTQ